MTESRNGAARQSISLALAIGLGGTILTGGAAWGIYSQRVETVEATQRSHGEQLQQHDRQITEMRAQYGEIIRRLDRIDRKLEERER